MVTIVRYFDHLIYPTKPVQKRKRRGPYVSSMGLRRSQRRMRCKRSNRSAAG
jgi:hypothetical protein